MERLKEQHEHEINALSSRLEVTTYPLSPPPTQYIQESQSESSHFLMIITSISY